MTDDKIWRRNLKRIRKEKGLTLDQLARLANTTKSQLSMLENGQRPFTQKLLGAILNELGLDFADIFCGCSFRKRSTDPADLNHNKLRHTHQKVVSIPRKKQAH
jgi:transcriptional regulator with XRE-family HTH domain